MPADTIVGDLAAARRVQVPTEGGQTRVAAIDYPFWMALGQRNFDQESPVVAQLETINIASPGHIVKKEDAAIGFEPLITTSEQSGTIPAAMMQGPGPLDPLRLTNSRSEEHTSELQSLMRISYAVFCLKKNIKLNQIILL